MLFASEPNFRGYTDGMQKVLWNAVYGADPAPGRTAPRLVASLAERRASAARTARRVTDLSTQMVIFVRPSAAAAVAAVLESNGLAAQQEAVSPGKVRFLVAGVSSGEEDPAARQVVADLSGLGKAVIAVRVP